MGSHDATPLKQILVPYIPAEATGVPQIAKRYGLSDASVRNKTNLKGLGRRIDGQWACSKVLWAMHMENDRQAMQAYWGGDRSSPAILAYFKRFGIHDPLAGEG